MPDLLSDAPAIQEVEVRLERIKSLELEMARFRKYEDETIARHFHYAGSEDHLLSEASMWPTLEEIRELREEAREIVVESNLSQEDLVARGIDPSDLGKPWLWTRQACDIYVVNYLDPKLYQALTRDPELLRTIGWRDFEKFLAGILERLGYEIELQQGTKDGGVDIIALSRPSPLGVHKYLVQAKRWTSGVSVEPVRELLFLQNHYRATKSCLATTSRFTRGAWKLAADYEWQLELRDYEGLKEWIALASER